MNKFIRIFNIALILIQLGISCYLITQYDLIPIHWDISGAIDSYGSPSVSLIIPLLSLITWGMIFFVKNHPDWWNVRNEIKKSAAGISIIRQMFDCMTAWSMILMTFLMYSILRGKLVMIGLMFIFALLACIIVFFIKRINCPDKES